VTKIYFADAKLGIWKSSDTTLSEVNLILLHTLRTCVSPK
jgi:hypothetical protein